MSGYRKIFLLACLALTGCDDATGFRAGNVSTASVQLDQSDKCIVWISVASQSNIRPDIGLRARIIGSECP